MENTDLIELCEEAIRFTQELIRIDTSNYGDGTGPGEEEAAQYVLDRLAEVGLSGETFVAAPKRHSVVVQIAGKSRDGLLVHGHLDAVPADPHDWSVDPFSGEIKDGCIWGRGAVDMKEMVGMMLAIVRKIARDEIVPSRDLVFAFLADEEAGGWNGARWLVRNHPELFAGCNQAISEVGGYSVSLPTPDGDSKRAYLLQTAEKGFHWATIKATGAAGHGSLRNDDNAIAKLSRALTRIAEYSWPQEYVTTVRSMFDGLTEITGIDDPAQVLGLLGAAKPFVEATLSNTSNLTSLSAGDLGNVIPSVATAQIDCRFLPGHQESSLDKIRGLCGDDAHLIVNKTGTAVEAPIDTPFVQEMADALSAEDPGARLVPYCMSAGTDNKSFSWLGISGYGFVPLKLPEGYEFARMFHGVEERVPVESVEFGTRVLWNLIAKTD